MMRPDSGVAKAGGNSSIGRCLEIGGWWNILEVIQDIQEQKFSWPLFERMFFVGILPPQKTKEKENTTQLALINLYFFFVNVSNTTLHEKN